MARTFDRATSTPFLDGIAGRNVAINGGMEVSQENLATQITLATAASKYAIDAWQGIYVHAAATAVFKTQQIAPPNSPSFGLGFPSCLQLIATTLSAMAGAGDLALLYQTIEGYRITKLGFGSATNPQVFTVGFWVCATIAGTATVSVRNNAANRSYLANFTINSANTWEYKTVTIPVDTTGTWVVNNGIGLYLGFCFGTGATGQSANLAWSAGNFIGTSSTTNFFASNNNNVNITGVGIWPGTDAPTAARSPFAQRPFSEELILCQRYYEKSFDYATAPAQNAGTNGVVYAGQTAGASTNQALTQVRYSVRKRAVPAVTLYNPNAANAQIRSSGATDWTASSAGLLGEASFGLTGTSPAATAAGQAAFVHFTADARL